MLPRTHAVLGFILSAVLFIFVPNVSLADASLVFLASVFTDFDHYLFYIFRKKDTSLKNAYGWFVKKRNFMRSLKPGEVKKYEKVIMLFHGVEFCILLVLLALVNRIFVFIFAGVLFHILLDIIELMVYKMPLHGKLSQIYTHKTNKKKKKLE